MQKALIVDKDGSCSMVDEADKVTESWLDDDYIANGTSPMVHRQCLVMRRRRSPLHEERKTRHYREGQGRADCKSHRCPSLLRPEMLFDPVGIAVLQHAHDPEALDRGMRDRLLRFEVDLEHARPPSMP